MEPKARRERRDMLASFRRADERRYSPKESAFRPLVGVQGSMHPVNTNFYQHKVKYHGSHVPRPASNVLHGMVHLSPSLFNQIFINDGERNINNHAGLSQFDLIPNYFPRRAYSISIFKGCLGGRMHINKVMKNERHAVIHENAPD
eukprot:scaffold2917_cov191-Amphora_coffeaeformis.AAC.49